MSCTVTNLVDYWCFNTLHLYGGGQFYWWVKPEYPEKQTVQSHRQT